MGSVTSQTAHREVDLTPRRYSTVVPLSGNRTTTDFLHDAVIEVVACVAAAAPAAAAAVAAHAIRVFPCSSLPRLADSKKITMHSDPTGGKGMSSGIVPLAHEGLLVHRPVNSLAFVPAGGDPLVLAAYGPVGAQLGAAELLKVCEWCGKGRGVNKMKAQVRRAALLLAAYGPVGAQLGAAELLKVWALCGKGCGKSINQREMGSVAAGCIWPSGGTSGCCSAAQGVWTVCEGV